eukprot:SAG11_NODE_580_length_8367_cov_3.375060_8_plen_243_part_00
MQFSKHISKQFLHNLQDYVRETVDDRDVKYQMRVERSYQHALKKRKEHESYVATTRNQIHELEAENARLTKNQKPWWWERMPWTRDWHPEWIIENVEEQRQTQIHIMEQHERKLAAAEARVDGDFTHSPLYKEFQALKKEYKRLSECYEKDKEHFGDIIAKYSNEGMFDLVEKRVKDGLKLALKQQESLIKEEQKALWKAKMSALKNEKRDLEEEVTDLEKEVKKLRKKLKAKVESSESDSE